MLCCDTSHQIRRPNRRERGFSLIETLGAIAILAVVVVSTSALSVGVMHRVYGGKVMTTATGLAQHVMERINRQQSYVYLEGLPGQSSVEKVFERGTVGGTFTVTPAETSANGVYWAERNEWRSLFLDADLPFGDGAANASSLTVRVEAVPTTAAFNTATMVRIQVRVRWFERGVRQREVFLETLNLRYPEPV